MRSGLLRAPGYWESRLFFTRALAAVYLIAFGAALAQFRPLLGAEGILPVPRFVARVPFRRAPSLFQLHYSDRFFAGCCWLGAALAVAAAVVVVTQLWLMLSGNFAWLNALTMTIALSVIDGRVLHHVLRVSPGHPLARPLGLAVAVLALTAGVAALSWRPARNLLSRHQHMNAAFDPLHLVNTYGAFGHVTRERQEVVIEGTADPDPGPASEWRAYRFKGKPGDLRRRPPQVAPYHLRLDWLLWFVGISPAYADPWLVPFLARLLRNDRATRRLLKECPFPDRPPAFVRASLYRYRFTTPEERRATGAWWSRTPTAELVRPLSLSGGRPIAE